MQIDLATLALLAGITIGISQTIKMWFKGMIWWTKAYGIILTILVSLGVTIWHMVTKLGGFDWLYLIGMGIPVAMEASGLYKFVKK